MILQAPAENNPAYFPHISPILDDVINPDFSETGTITYGARALFKNGEIH